jgi:glucose/arabinose dehydrogenase
MKKFIALFFVLLSSAGSVFSQFQAGSVTVTPSTLTTNLQVPWELIWGPDNFIWMTERYGRISRVNPANGQVLPLITLSDVQQTGESGLLGMALHPNFTQNPYVYVAYTYLKNGATTEKLVRLTYNGSILASPLVLLDDIKGANIHDGSRLLFLPDQTLLMSTGDASNTSFAQNLSGLNGKFLRLNLDGSIPVNNPIPGSYIYSFGHRNAQGLAYANGKIYSSEHGPGTDDEFNLIEVNRNYGWPTVRGMCNTASEQTFCNANNVREPLAAWTPTIAVAGITYYNHPAIPEWQNSVLMATLKDRKLVQLKLNPAGTAVASQTIYLSNAYGRLRSICVSPAGKVYIGTSNQDGRATPAATDDRIIVLENLAYSPTGTREELKSGEFTFINDTASQNLYLKFAPGSVGQEVSLHDLSGKTIFKRTVPAGLEITFKTSGLPAGIYLIRTKNLVEKIVIP